MVFNSPLSDQKVSRLIDLVELESGSRVLDAGCGEGEFLIRLIEAKDVEGLGIDSNSEVLKIAREKAKQRIPDANCIFQKRDLQKRSIKENDFEMAICIGSTHAFGEGEAAYGNAIGKLSRAVKPDGLILIGEGYWKKDPDQEYLDLIGDPVGIYHDHAGNMAFAEKRGLLPIYAATSNEEEWDEFESSYRKKLERLAKENPSDPDISQKLERNREWRAGYEKWGRDTMGFGFYLFRNP